jgi:Acetyltransferase (GNAT) domain
MLTHWGKGFATEALRRILEFGFEHLSLERILGDCRRAQCRLLETATEITRSKGIPW